MKEMILGIMFLLGLSLPCTVMAKSMFAGRESHKINNVMKMPSALITGEKLQFEETSINGKYKRIAGLTAIEIRNENGDRILIFLLYPTEQGDYRKMEIKSV